MKHPLTFKRIAFLLHLWLGLATGVVVIIVSITGCIYAFEKEIRLLTEPWQNVAVKHQPFMPPSALNHKAVTWLNAQGDTSAITSMRGIHYYPHGKSSVAWYNHPANGYTVVYQNPYTGDVLAHKSLRHDVLRVLFAGHYSLWLPYQVGKPIVGWSILLFVVVMLSGLVLWWPKHLNGSAMKGRLLLNLKTSWKKLVYDLHNVLGFYVALVAIIIALTGLVWAFSWFDKAWYFTLSGGQSIPAASSPVSDTTHVAAFTSGVAVDHVWQRMVEAHPLNEGSIRLQFAHQSNDPIIVTVNPEDHTYYKRQTHYFDRYTLTEMTGHGIYDQKFSDASTGDKIYRMNYDIHTGSVLGLPGRILAFIASLICASLPVTGFVLWWNKRKRRVAK